MVLDKKNLYVIAPDDFLRFFNDKCGLNKVDGTRKCVRLLLRDSECFYVGKIVIYIENSLNVVSLAIF